ncbi:hypothetical protein C0581_01470 [Candidatus Parcubacteria bacterium]|nr:MAG: hypothetical protein C0581_01470 [Candidatus Parcubacteria bacterium]
MSLFSKSESYLGVDIGAHGIKLIELKKTKGRPQLWTYGILDKDLDIHLHAAQEKDINDLLHEGDIKYENEKKKQEKKNPTSIQELIMQDSRVDEYAELLKALLKEAKVESRRATSSLPVSHVFHAILNLPKVDDKEIPKIVRAEVGKMINRPIEEMQVVHQKVGNYPEKAKKYITLLVTAAPKALVAFYTAIFQRAGLQLEELETEAFALARSLVGRDSTVSMMVDIGAERTNFFIIDGGVPMTHRSLQIGGNNFDKILSNQLGLEMDKVKQIKRDLSSSDVSTDLFMTLLDPIAKEIQYSFDLYLRQSGNEGKRPEKIVLTGGSGLFPPIGTYIEQEFPLKVFVGDPWARVIYQDGLKGVLDEIGPRMAVGIGLALRNF